MKKRKDELDQKEKEKRKMREEILERIRLREE